MAPTSDERREVAERLRELDHEITSYDTIESGSNKLEKAVYGNTSFSPIEYSVRNLCGLANTLADLIDPQERTCHNSAPHYLRFHCSECHYVIYHDDANETGEPEEDGINFCPNCGARVVSEHEE